MAVKLPDGIDARHFIEGYWQQKPLLIRAGLPASIFPLAGDELAGLACEPDLESRLIIERGQGDWQVRHGPFDASEFARLPARQWTLLVQDVDKFVPEVADLIDEFTFVPRWRIDDIMISYATDGGGVGPHTDAYDVFLIQAEGTRRWRISYRDYSDDDLIPGLEQRILARFDADEDWLLAPGDILYLPPNVAHWGTAQGNCMTYSLGFRAPGLSDIAADWFQHLVSVAPPHHLMDPADLSAAGPAQLTPGLFQNAAGLLDGLPRPDSSAFKRWLGSYLTEPKPQFETEPPEPRWTGSDLATWLAQGHSLARHPFARVSWAELGDEVALFAQGECHTLPATDTDAVKAVAEQRRLSAVTLQTMAETSPEVRQLLLDLVNRGLLEKDGIDS